ncbi:response regulator [Paenibacillus sp. HN-1]|uniref:response regulator transcription factor n=1 Tax=Paenibacillus TaxID=44249 RepID=UPI001CA9A2E9|nr:MULTISPECIES: helix-turn-helix domain-containing protein [Paenibacillus]MBY9079142.1 response regulator [Paenibacillus sp. CGMCC 1.18879]MBY9086920.1 response regulator [Paenibacillus sinensis]
MYKAVLVDDEMYDLEGLRRLIPWSELGIEVVCGENKPLAALQFIENNDFDLLITDIKMPVLSGIELSRKAMETHPGLKTVFISGYQDFQYAKQALDLKANAYILKPVDDEEIVSVLRAVVGELELERRKEADDREDIETFDFIKNDVIRHLLEGTIDRGKLSAFLKRYPLDLTFESACAVLIEADDVMLRLGSAPEAGQTQLDRLFQWLESYAAGRGLGVWCRLNRSQAALIYTGGEEGIESRLEEMVAEARRSGTFTITVSYGAGVTAAEDLPVSFSQARTFMNGKMFVGKNRVIPPGSSKTGIGKNVRDLSAVLEGMFGAMAGYRLVNICDYIDELFAVAAGFEHPVKVYQFSVHIASRLEAYLGTLNESFESLLGRGIEQMDVIHQLETVDDIKRWLRNTLFHISEILFMKKQHKNRRLMEDIEHYIRERMAENITLREVANHFAYSPNHLGLLFKEHTGESFNEFLVRIRMERAIRLLDQHQYKIYEVADLVGYKNIAYFSRQFREYFNMTAADYRKQS